MKNLNDHLNRMRSLIESEHGKINFINEEEEKEDDKKKVEAENKKKAEAEAKNKKAEAEAKKKRDDAEAEKKRSEVEVEKKRDEESKKKNKEFEFVDIISLEEEIDNSNIICDIDMAIELDEYLDDLDLRAETIDKIKNKILDLVKSC